MKLPSDSIIEYAAGYKYQLVRSYSLPTGIIPPAKVGNAFLLLDADGTLTIFAGYAWDGPSGPTIDTQNFMRGSLVHDALYQLMREGLISPHRKTSADKLLRTLCREDGMSALRAWWVYVGVTKFGHDAAKRQLPQILTAP